MVRLTVDLIARSTSGYTKKRTDESIQHFLKRLSHLYLEDRNIDEIGDDLAACRNLIVLYLYDNSLTRSPNLNGNANLTHLYLQNNQISRLENMAALKKLTKLYVGGNHITVVEGLDKLPVLQELHIENQHLPPGEKLLFDPRTLSTLAASLQVLNISGNALDSIRDLSCLRLLNQFMATDNQLSDMKELAHVFSVWHRLSRLELIGNPLCHKAKYRDRIIIMAPALEMLDGKEVTETAKQFLRNWQANKDALKRKRELTQTSCNDGAAIYSEGDLPPLSSRITAQRGANAHIPGYIMPALPRKQFQEVLARSASQPNSAGLLTRTPHNGHAALSDMSVAPRYLNTMGTTYHEPHAIPVKMHRSAGESHRTNHINLGSNYSLGDRVM